MQKTAASILFCISMTALAAGCYAEAYGVAPGAVVVSSAPPAEIVYAESACPDGYVWVGDYYDWDGYSWILVSGGCAYRPGYIWIAPTYIHVQGGVKYVAGYWTPAQGHPHHAHATPPSHPKTYYATPPGQPKTCYATPPTPPKKAYDTGPAKAHHSHAFHPKGKAIPK